MIRLHFYLAARFSEKDRIALIRTQLQSMGHIVTSTWTDETAAPNSTLADVTEDELKVNSERDLTEINQCDVLVLFTVDPTVPTVRGGRHFESGYAVGLGKEFWIVGPRENIFHYTEAAEIFADTQEFLAYAKELISGSTAA